jgi:ankyrin repeat protein
MIARIITGQAMELSEQKINQLFRDAADGKVGDIEQWLKNGIKPDQYRNNHNQTLLHVAAAHGQTRTVDLLIAHKASANEPDSNGKTPMHLAAANGHASVVRRLKRVPNIHIIVWDKNHMTPEDYAAQNGHENTLDALRAKPIASAVLQEPPEEKPAVDTSHRPRKPAVPVVHPALHESEFTGKIRELLERTKDQPAQSLTPVGSVSR